MVTFTEYEFMPVGQGLFAAGTLGQCTYKAPQFRWVYDCGTLSGSALIDNGLDKLEADVKRHNIGKPSLDLVAISHFDTDHLSGLKDLLTRFRVETLMLPFTHLAQRLRHMFSQRPYTAKANRTYYIDPIQTILSLEGMDIGQIVLVLPSSGEPIPDQPTDPRLPRGLSDENLREREGLLFDEGNVDEAEDQAELDAMRVSARARNVPLRLMRANSAATYRGVWEFVPYNEPKSSSKACANFLRQVEAKRHALLSSHSHAAISDLRKTYDAHFGKSAKERNIISLFLYSGPIGQRLHRLYVREQPIKLRYQCPMWGCPLCWKHFWRNAKNLLKGRGAGGVLYTGDGYVNTLDRWKELQHHFGVQRVGSLTALQVMHHGALSNWFSGLASLINPTVSIFSSDPNRGIKRKKARSPVSPAKKHRKPHPHAEVLKDFHAHQPLQADKVNGVQILTIYR